MRFTEVTTAYSFALQVHDMNFASFSPELEALGRHEHALKNLHEFITNRKFRQWTATHEAIMYKLLEFCLKLRNSQIAKDGS